MNVADEQRDRRLAATAAPRAARGAAVELEASSVLTDRREHVLFVLACGLIAVHVLVDAFVALEPGVGREEHLVSGLVPLGLLAIAVLLHPRLRAGLQAAVSLTLGVLALVGAGVAVVSAAQTGPSGDDWSGFLLAPAGVLLCTLGAASMWRSRKPYGRVWLRRALIVVATAAFAYWVVLPVGFAIVATTSLGRGLRPPTSGGPMRR